MKQAGGYALASAVMAATAFFTVPFLVRLLGQSEFGRWAIVEALLVAGAPLALLGTNWGVLKQIAHDHLDPSRVFFRQLLSAQPFMLLPVAAVWLTLTAFDFSWNEKLLVCAALWIESLFCLVVSVFRADERSMSFLTAQLIRGGLMISLLWAATSDLLAISSVSDFVVVRLTAVGLASTMGLVLIITQTSGAQARPELPPVWALYKDAVAYGGPLLVMSTLTSVTQLGDRFFLGSLLEYESLAIYVVHVKVASALSTALITPFGLWWPAHRFRVRDQPDGGKVHFSLLASAFLLVLLASGGALWLSAEWLLPLFAPGVPFEPDILLLLLLGVVLVGMLYPLNVGLLDEGKTHKNVPAAAATAVAHLALCALVIPWWGLLGAAWATVISGVARLAGFVYLSQREFHVPFRFGRMTGLTAAAVGILVGLGEWLPSGELGWVSLRVGVYVVSLAGCTWLLGFRWTRDLWSLQERTR